jgi:hypothetical protein
LTESAKVGEIPAIITREQLKKTIARIIDHPLTLKLSSTLLCFCDVSQVQIVGVEIIVLHRLALDARIPATRLRPAGPAKVALGLAGLIQPKLRF